MIDVPLAQTSDPGEADRDRRVEPERIRAMFGAIAPTYDLLNRALSLGVDRVWRRQAASVAVEHGPRRVLDVATGTADLALAVAAAAPRAEVVGVDFAEEMLARARAKAASRGGRVRLELADGTALPYEDGSFDAVTIGYGLRNFDDRARGLAEFFRVLAPGGRLVVLEFPPPPPGPSGALFRLYFERVLPWIGGVVSRRGDAYRYLPRSVIEFPTPDELGAMMCRAGFRDVRYKLQTFGISAIHVGGKP